MGPTLSSALLMSGNVIFSAIIADQQAGLWYVLPLFLSFFIFLVSGFAETNRLPFDLPEAESELIAGYHTEYSAMKFSFFFIAEYASVVTVCALFTALFFALAVFGLLDSGVFIRGSGRQRTTLEARAERATVTS